MPTEVGIHDFTAINGRKAWVPTCVGMTSNGGWYVNLYAGWYYILRLRGNPDFRGVGV